MIYVFGLKNEMQTKNKIVKMTLLVNSQTYAKPVISNLKYGKHSEALSLLHCSKEWYFIYFVVY